MTDFKFMDKAVEDICKSMREEPHRWRISTHEVKDLLVVLNIGQQGIQRLLLQSGQDIQRKKYFL